MNRYIIEITSRLAEPGTGINAAWEICSGRVGLIEGFENWQPLADTPSLIVTILKWVLLAPLFYLGVVLLFASMGTLLGWTALYIYHVILEASLFAYNALLFSIISVLVAVLIIEASAPSGARVGQTSYPLLGNIIGLFAYLCSTVYAVVKTKLKELLRRRRAKQEIVWLIVFTVGLSPIYIKAVSWSPGWRRSTLGFIAFIALRTWPEAMAAREEEMMARILARMEREDLENELDLVDETPLPGYNDDQRPPPYIANDNNAWDDIDLGDGGPPIRRLRSPPPQYRRARRLPRPLTDCRMDARNPWPYTLLCYYVGLLEPRIYRRVRAEYQVEFLAHRILTTLSLADIRRSVRDPSVIEQYIDMAINYAEAIEPQLFVLFQPRPPQGTASIGSGIRTA
ncbi:hypothetical protein GGR58DRAFT_57977 [Xylaria digitata]|nr:hypothetical protein GGR58DRAFT_57977 [Xylaria digitata]